MSNTRKLVSPAVKVHFKLKCSNRSEESKILMDDIGEQWQFFKKASIDAARNTVEVRRPKKEERLQPSAWKLAEKEERIKEGSSARMR